MFESGMSVVTLALCARIRWLLISIEVHIKSLHIIIIIIKQLKTFLLSRY